MSEIRKNIALNYMDHPLNGLMSRSGSFPLSVALELLKEYARPGAVIVDPFCGKGTTLLAARLLGMRAYGTDVAPEAVVCSRAKIVDVDPADIYEYIKGLKIRRRSLSDVPDKVRIFYHPSTLSQILCIRDQLIADVSSTDENISSHGIFTLAVLLGILHGHANYSLSVSSSHAFSMAPTYVEKYARKHHLKAELKDVKACLIEKALRSLIVPIPTPVGSKVVCGSAAHIAKLFPRLRNKVDVILTSPPYLNAQTYGKDNWLRIWVLGEDYKQISNQYLQTGSISKYEIAMKPIFSQFSELLKPGGRLICIAGDVRLKRSRKNGTQVETFQTGRFLAEICCSNGSAFQLEEISEHHVPSSLRYLHALNRSNGHSKRDLVETVFVAKKTRRG